MVFFLCYNKTTNEIGGNYMVYYKHEWQDGELITSDNLNNLESGIQSAHTQVSVKDFGALGDGVTDDTQAFIDAITFAQNSNDYIYIPVGTYLITKPIYLNGVTLIGESLNKTIFKSTTSVCFYTNNAIIKNFSIDITGAPNGSDAIFLGYESNGVYSGGWYSDITNITITGNYLLTDSTGIHALPHNTTSSKGAFSNYINNITLNSIGRGIVLESGDYGWCNGNTITNITINGFAKNGVLLTSNSSTSVSSQRNTFDNIEILSLSTLPVQGAIALEISHGQNNIFNNISDWNDTGSRDDIIGLNITTSPGSPTIFDIINNTITNSKFEHRIPEDDNILNLQNGEIIIMNYVKSYYISGVKKYLEKKKLGGVMNLLPNNIIANEYNKPNTNGITISDLRGTGVVENGPYLSLNANSTFNYSFNPIQVNMVSLSKYVSAAMEIRTSAPINLSILPTIEVTYNGVTQSVSPKFTTANKLTEIVYHINWVFDLSELSNLIPNSSIVFKSSLNSKISTDIFNVVGFKLSNKPTINYDFYEHTKL